MSVNRKIIFNNTIYQLIGKTISMGVTVLATLLIARIYGRESYGAFNLMQTWPALVFIIVDFGLNAVAVRQISKEPDKTSKYFSTILYIRILMSLAFIFTMGIAIVFFPYSQVIKQGIMLNLALILTQALFATTNIIFQSRLRYDLSTIGYVSGYMYIVIATLVMVFMRAPVMWLSFNYVIGGLITFGVNARFIKRMGISLVPKLDKELGQYLLVQSLPLGLMFVFSQLNFKSDSILLSLLNLPAEYGLNNNESVAIYGLPYKVFEVALVLPTFIMNAVYPILLKDLQVGRERLYSTFVKTLQYMLIGGVATGIIGFLMAGYVINLLGGADFSSSTLVLQILVLPITLYFITQPLSWLIVSLDAQRTLPLVYGISAVFNLTANFLLIPIYSFYASAIITHLSEFIVLILLVYYARKAWVQKYSY